MYVYLQYWSEIRLYRLNKPIMIDIVLIIITGACYWIYYLCTIWSFFLCFIWIIINLIETVWGWQGRCVYMRAWHLQVHIGSHTCHTLVVIQASCVIHHRHTSYKTSISAYTCENSQLPKWWHGCGCWHCCRWWSWQHSYRNIHWSADSAGWWCPHPSQVELFHFRKLLLEMLQQVVPWCCLGKHLSSVPGMYSLTAHHWRQSWQTCSVILRITQPRLF